MYMIKVNEVSKSFNNSKVLNGISYEIKDGDFVLITGENGAGKSTLLKILIGLLIPDSGDVQIDNFNVKKDWKKISKEIGVVMSNERSLYWKLSGRENLDIFGGIYGVKRNKKKEKIIELLRYFNLIDHIDKPVENYSTGMRKKLMLCKALIHEPKTLFIDEALNGLDPKATEEMIFYLNKLNENGLTIIMISHILHGFNDDIKIMHLKDGKIDFIKRMKEIKNNSNGDIYSYYSNILSEGEK
ncbi:ABC transporter ATP-binding protein [Geotoga petraea]|uniref:ABC transporter ATP-binding protein n=2 Tax=Geotoga petraea TaxID=28234 RepID=A0A4Z0VW08_9BACT|nr:ABC transporter ATP-binding protein [Geotoga petraea]